VDAHGYAISGNCCSFNDRFPASIPHGFNQFGLPLSAQSLNANEYH
jgi:hypothetical protein